MPRPLIHALGLVKQAAARPTASLGVLDAELADAIEAAAARSSTASSTTSSRSSSGRPARARRPT